MVEVSILDGFDFVLPSRLVFPPIRWQRIEAAPHDRIFDWDNVVVGTTHWNTVGYRCPQSRLWLDERGLVLQPQPTHFLDPGFPQDDDGIEEPDVYVEALAEKVATTLGKVLAEVLDQPVLTCRPGAGPPHEIRVSEIIEVDLGNRAASLLLEIGL